MVRKPATEAHTIQRRILLTRGSEVLSTMLGLAVGVLAAAGSGGFAGAVIAGGAPAATVSPGVAVTGVVLLLADDPSLAEVSTTRTLRQS